MKELKSKIETALGKGDYGIANELLIEFFEKVVSKDSSKLKDFFEYRKQIKHKSKRPCVCLDDIAEDKLLAFFRNLDTNLWNLLPKAKPRKIKDLRAYQAHPQDPMLIDLVKPFVGAESSQLSMLGVHFDDKGIVATNAIKLVFLPKIANKKGTYCMTRKCFQSNSGELEYNDWKFPDYQNIIPKTDTTYDTFLLDIAKMRDLIHTLENNGIRRGGDVRLNFVCGDKKYLVIDAYANLLSALEAMAKLGQSQAKIWLESPHRPVIISASNASIEQISKLEESFVLLMPMAIGRDDSYTEFEKNMTLSDPVYDLDKGTFFFWKRAKKAVSFAPASPIKQPDAKAKKILIAKAKAAARIRILKLKKSAA